MPGSLEHALSKALIASTNTKIRRLTRVAFSGAEHPGQPEARRRGRRAVGLPDVQEALTNVLKHANGANACVDIRYTEHDLCVDVVNDGAVVTLPAGSEGKGLVGMRERTELLNGELVAVPQPAGDSGSAAGSRSRRAPIDDPRPHLR